VDRSHYDNLLTRLGYLEKEQQLLLEYKEGLKRKNEELIETRTWLEESIQENKQVQEQNKHIKSSSIFTIQKKDAELKELRKNLTELRQELGKVKKRGLLKRIFNK
jgi:septal ring factor EnvC (AmiA/AmiB activator)